MKVYSTLFSVFRSVNKLLVVFLCVFFYSSNAQDFSESKLKNFSIHNPTSLQFGPDGRLYVSQQNGLIKIFEIEKKDSSSYEVTSTETVNLVQKIPNHNDDGSPNPEVNTRLVTGIFVAGTESNPVIFVSSSDSRIGGGALGTMDLCTNSGIISKLSKEKGNWEKVDLVRGLPRSQENHAPNGLQFDEDNNRLFAVIGGITNAGGPSSMFGMTNEYALSAAILSIDLDAIEAMSIKDDPTGNHPYKYDLPTLDDPTRENNADGSDVNDPWGGNRGLNQAKIDPDGPVQVYASGFRNTYDILITSTPGREGNMYAIDNGANPGYGGFPYNEGPDGTVTNNYDPDEPGSLGPGENSPMVNNLDGMHFIGNINDYDEGSYYGGHPNPVRANPEGAGLFTHFGGEDEEGVWRSSTTDSDYPLPNDWPPVPVDMANPAEGEYQNPGEEDPSLVTFTTSTNGMCEYKASNYDMKGDILTVGYSITGPVYHIKLNESGSSVVNNLGDRKLYDDSLFASGMDKPLDITCQGDDDVFPGSVWIAGYGDDHIFIYEPMEKVTASRVEKDYTFKLYPNPVNDRLFLNVNADSDPQYQVEIYNELGQVLLDKQFYITSGASEEVLDISSFSPGVYQVKVTFDSGYEVVKVVKL
ncbi:T9SS type A sorting domain-containing protein [Cytophagaceae bacterium ABcell3]|nr:T9SS type A sorting domain-containing protein [Cytophagaceae bacterium ABcell3]